MKIRKKSTVFIIAISLINTEVNAGIPVTDYQNIIQNTANTITTVDQYYRQGLEYAAKLESLKLQIQEVESWTEADYSWESVQEILGNLADISNKIDYFDNTIRNINDYLEKFQDISYYERSPCFTEQGCSDAEREIMEKNRRDASENQKEANYAMFEMLQAQKKRLHDDALYIEQQRQRASTVKDQKAILAHANQFALEQNKQLMQIRALLVAQQEAATAEVMKKSDRESQEEAKRNYLFDMSKDVDYSIDKGIPLTAEPKM